MEKASQVLEARGDDVDVALLDLVLPDGTGEDLAKALAASRPSVPVVIMSGSPAVLGRGRSGPRQTFLVKPFTAEELGRASRRALKGTTA